MSFATYYSLFEIGPDKYSIHPYSPRKEIIRFLKDREDIDLAIIGGGILGLALAHQCVLNDLTVVLLEGCDYGVGRSQIPIWSDREWFKSEHIKSVPRVIGKISMEPNKRFAHKIYIDSSAKIKEGFLHDSKSLVFDLLRAARSEGVFALNFIKAETFFRLGERHTIKLFDELAEERFDIKARLVVNATQFKKIGPLQKEVIHNIKVYKETAPLPYINIIDEGITLIPNGQGEVFCISEMKPSEKIIKDFALIDTGVEKQLPIWGEEIETPGLLASGILTLPQGGSIPSIINAALESIGTALGKEKLSSVDRPLPSTSRIFKERQKLFLTNETVDEEFLKAFIEAEQIYSYEGFLKREPNTSNVIKNILSGPDELNLFCNPRHK